MLQASLPATT